VSGRARWRAHAAALLLLAGLLPASARADDVLRVGTSGDYAPFSFVSSVDPEALEGFVAMSGITVRPERSLEGRFSVAVATSGAMALVDEDGPFRGVQDLRLPGLRLAVNAGGHLERVARDQFPRATLIAVADNAAVLPALLDGSVDAAISDDLEAVQWRAAAPGLRALGPFSRDRKAYLVRPDRRELAARLDTWLLERERDGTLAELRELHLGRGEETATPLLALLAAMDERLELMPLVAEAKRAAELPVRAPEREEAVVENAVAAAREAAERSGVTGLPDRWVRRLFRAQIEAAVGVQEFVLSQPPGPSAPALETLRPALDRIGERIAAYLVRLPGPLDPVQVERQAIDAIEVEGLDASHVSLLADLVAQISRYRDA
jgi:cyclohexadienyl dehydratase